MKVKSISPARLPQMQTSLMDVINYYKSYIISLSYEDRVRGLYEIYRNNPELYYVLVGRRSVYE